MVRVVSVFLLASACLAATAFSLERPSNRISSLTNKLMKENTTKNVLVNKNTAIFSSEAEAAPVASITATETKKTSLIDAIWNEQTKLSFYLIVWYLGNVYYNIYNKKACIALGKNAQGGSNLHWALSAAQLLVGAIFVVPMWLTGIRKAPELTGDNYRELAPVGLWASLAHAFSVLALGAGAVSFGQIVKSAEPVFAAATNAIILKDIDHPVVYLALLPIIGGVSLASLKELSFSWTALIAASLANQAAAFKNVVSKGVMGKPWAKALGPQNTYAVMNILALLFTLPFVLGFDLREFAPVYKEIIQRGTGADVIKFSVFSGLAFYLYNEASFLALERLSPVTHSVANTLKRVVIIVASSIVFKTPISLLGGIGSGIAVLGTLLYSLAKQKYSKKKGGH